MCSEIVEGPKGPQFTLNRPCSWGDCKPQQKGKHCLIAYTQTDHPSRRVRPTESPWSTLTGMQDMCCGDRYEVDLIQIQYKGNADFGPATSFVVSVVVRSHHNTFVACR